MIISITYYGKESRKFGSIKQPNLCIKAKFMRNLVMASSTGVSSKAAHQLCRVRNIGSAGFNHSYRSLMRVVLASNDIKGLIWRTTKNIAAKQKKLPKN